MKKRKIWGKEDYEMTEKMERENESFRRYGEDMKNRVPGYAHKCEKNDGGDGFVKVSRWI